MSGSPVAVYVTEVQALGRSTWTVEVRDRRGRRSVIGAGLTWPAAMRAKRAVEKTLAGLLRVGAVKLG